MSQLYAARFAPLYGGPDDLTRGDAGDAVAAGEEGRGAADVGWSLEQVATCVVASPREGAPEADAALHAAIAAAAACRHVDTSALLPPWYVPGAATARHRAPRATGARASHALGSGLPSALLVSAAAVLGHRGSTAGGRELGGARRQEAREQRGDVAPPGSPG